MGILNYHRQRFSQVILFDSANVDAVVGDRPALDFVKSVDQVNNRRLSCACRADKGDLLYRLCKQTDAIQYFMFFRISEYNLIKPHITLQ